MPPTPKRNPDHDPAIKAAVIAALLAGQSVSQVAREYKLPKGTVSAWKQRKAARVASSDAVTARESADAATQKIPPGESIGDLLIQLVRENLKGLVAGAAMMQDAAWMRQQNAADLAVFLGVTNDKTVRMLEAMDASASSRR